MSFAEQHLVAERGLLKEYKMFHNTEDQKDTENDPDTDPLNIPGIDSDDGEKRILVLKCAKAKSKTAFTKLKNKLLAILDNEDDALPSRTLVREVQACMINAQERALVIMERLSSEYSTKMDSESMRKVDEEIQQLEDASVSASTRAEEYLESRRFEASSITSSLTNTSEKLSQIQRQEILARQQADKIRSVLSQKEEEFALKKRHMQEEHDLHMKEMESILVEERGRLHEAETKLAIYNTELEQQLEEELGMKVEKTDLNTTHKYLQLIQAERQALKDQYDQIRKEFDEVFNQKMKMLDEKLAARDTVVLQEKVQRNRSADTINVEADHLGKDMWNQLERVSMPVFAGDKSSYHGWRAAFDACIDQAPVSSEYKLLQLKKYLGGEPLTMIKKLGHSPAAYTHAKDKLEKRYGGKRRQIAAHLDELERFKAMKSGNAKDFEEFADLLDTTVVNLQEAKRFEELGNGTLYVTLLRKLAECQISEYLKWIAEKNKVESVETLREWALRESEYQVIASETVRGVGSSTPQKAYFGSHACKNSSSGHRLSCVLCDEDHNITLCPTLESMSVSERWDCAKRHRLCYQCFSGGHLGYQCKNSVKCGVDGCQRSHNRLLHEKRDYVSRSCFSDSMPTESSFRTVPVILSNGQKQLKVNALLDDSCSKTFVNEDVADKLGLHGHKESVTVDVLGGKVELKDSEAVKVWLESTDGEVSCEIKASTVDRVADGLSVVDWNKYSNQWDHLREITFPDINSNGQVELLIGLDQLDLQCAYKEAYARRGDPVARFTPLGWTCVGPVKCTY